MPHRLTGIPSPLLGLCVLKMSWIQCRTGLQLFPVFIKCHEKYYPILSRDNNDCWHHTFQTDKGVSVLTRELSGKTLGEIEAILDSKHLDPEEASNLLGEMREMYKSVVSSEFGFVTECWITRQLSDEICSSQRNWGFVLFCWFVWQNLPWEFQRDKSEPVIDSECFKSKTYR